MGLVAAVFILMLVAFGVLAGWSNIIRDPGPLRYYSLARMQMALWFFIVVVASLGEDLGYPVNTRSAC